MITQLKKLFLVIFFTTLTIICPAIAEDNSEPLMIIRFNQDAVPYERQLQKAVSSALNVKPSTFFDIVSVVPDTENKENNKQLRKESSYLTAQVIENIKKNGIADDRLRVTYQHSKIIENNEVQIFVR